MPWSGGVYSRGYPSWTNDASANLPISATKFDTEDNDFQAGLNNCLTKDGLSVPTSPMIWGLAAGQPLALTRGNDGTVFSIGRTGGANNPGLQFSVTDGVGATLNLTTAQQLALAINGSNVIALTGSNVTLSQSSGLLTINSTTATNAALLALSLGGTGKARFGVEGTAGANVTGSSIGDLFWYSLGGSFLFSINGATAALKVGPNGNVTINAPITGSTLSLSGAGILLSARGLTVDGDGLQVGRGTGTNAPYFRANFTDATTTTLLDANSTAGSPLLNLSANSVVGLQVDANGEAGIATPSTIGGLGGSFTQVGYMDTPQVNITANASLALTHRGKSIYITGSTASQTLTIPANASVAFPVSTTIIVINISTQNWSVAITTDTLEWLPSAGTGTRTLAVGGVMTLYKDTATHWLAWGFGIS